MPLNLSYLDPSAEQAKANDPAKFHLILMPTEKCNFRCTYCYEDFKGPRMSQQTVDGIKYLITKKAPSLKHLEISWFGGEPLLAKSVIKEIQLHLTECKQQFTNLKTHVAITTNGYLLDLLLAQQLVASHVNKFQISIDGGESSHNLSRILANGGHTFDRIWNNIVSLLESDLKLTLSLRLHYTKSTVASVKELLTSLRKYASDKRLQIQIKAIENLGGSGEVNSISPSEQLEIERDIVSQHSELKIITRQFVKDTYVCYAAKPNSLLIRADGSVGKCTVALNDPRNHVGKLSGDGVLNLEESKIASWASVFELDTTKFLACPYKYIKSL